MMVEVKLTERQYCYIRSQAKTNEVDMYPAYNINVATKRLCYPTGSVITKTKAEVPVQNILDHTMARLLQFQE